MTAWFAVAYVVSQSLPLSPLQDYLKLEGCVIMIAARGACLTFLGWLRLMGSFIPRLRFWTTGARETPSLSHDGSSSMDHSFVALPSIYDSRGYG
jgi:hypothetical protein